MPTFHSPSRRRHPGARTALFTTMLAGVRPASAHPGHALTDSSMGHLATSPDHLLALAILGCLLWAASGWLRSQPLKRLLRFGGAACLLTAALVWTQHS